MAGFEGIGKRRSSWLLFVLRGVVAILFGFALIASPAAGLAALVMLFGVYAIVDGLFAIFAGAPRRAGLIVAGIIGIIAGIAAFAMPLFTAITFVYIVAAWGIAMGVAHLFDAFMGGRELGVDWFMALAGIFAIALGALVIARPAWGLITVLVASGIYAITSGIWFIVVGLRVHGIQNRIRIRDHGRLSPV